MKVSWSLCKAFLNLTLCLLEDYIIYQPDNINYLEIYSPMGNVIEQILFSFILASWEKKVEVPITFNSKKLKNTMYLMGFPSKFEFLLMKQ